MGKFLYIPQSATNDRYYIGSTDDLNRRFKEHNSGQTKSTKSGLPWEIVYTNEFDDSISGLKAERCLKLLKSRSIVEGIISGSIIIQSLMKG